MKINAQLIEIRKDYENQEHYGDLPLTIEHTVKNYHNIDMEELLDDLPTPVVWQEKKQNSGKTFYGSYGNQIIYKLKIH